MQIKNKILQISHYFKVTHHTDHKDTEHVIYFEQKTDFSM